VETHRTAPRRPPRGYNAAMLSALTTLLLATALSLPIGQSEPSGSAPPATPGDAPKTPADDSPDALRRASFNVDKTGLALQGYDPVAYLEGGAKEGSKSIVSTWRGVTYRFATAANKEKFDADPAKYEPPYGGWCAWAVIDGDKVEIDPTNFRVVDGKVYLFYKGWLGNARNDWDKLVTKKTAKGAVKDADSGWSKLAKADADAYAKDHPEWKRKDAAK
jgi:YHS domain-containing protein